MSSISSLKNEYSDEELCRLTAAGDRDAEELLVKRYLRLVRMCARPYFLAGGDSEDLIQEATFGLLKAIREFDSTRDAKFKTFAEVCIRNRIRSAVTTASRSKHAPLNDSIPLVYQQGGGGRANASASSEIIAPRAKNPFTFFARPVLSGNQRTAGMSDQVCGQRDSAHPAKGGR